MKNQAFLSFLFLTLSAFLILPAAAQTYPGMWNAPAETNPPDPRWQIPAAHIGAQAEQPKPSDEPLPPPSAKNPPAGKDGEKKDAVMPEWQKMLAMVGVVAGGLMILFYLLRKLYPEHPKPLPREAFEILGKSSLAFHQQVYLLRCGRKLFLVAVSSLGVERIGEIDSPMDVDHLLRTCRGEKSPGLPESSPRAATPEGVGEAGAPPEAGRRKMSFDEIYQQITR